MALASTHFAAIASSSHLRACSTGSGSRSGMSMPRDSYSMRSDARSMREVYRVRRSADRDWHGRGGAEPVPRVGRRVGDHLELPGVREAEEAFEGSVVGSSQADAAHRNQGPVRLY